MRYKVKITNLWELVRHNVQLLRKWSNKSGMKKPLSVLSIIFVMIAFLFGKITFVPPIVRAFTSLPLFFVVPYFFGHLVYYLLKCKYRCFLSMLDLISKITIKWFFGVLILSIFAMIFQYAKLFEVYMWIIFLGIISIIILFLFRKLDFHEDYIAIVHKRGIFIIIAGLIGTIPPIVSSMFIPFPWFGMNYDQPIALIQPVVRAMDDHYLMLDRRIPEVLLTFFPCLISNITPSQFAWCARFLLAIIFAIGVFLFANNVIFKENYSALLTVLVASFVFSSGANPPVLTFFDIPAQSFRSSTLLFALFPWVLLVTNNMLFKCYELEKSVNSIEKRTLLLLTSFALLTFAYLIFPETRWFNLPNFYKPLKWNPIILPMLYLTGIISVLLIKHGKNRIVYLFSFTIMFVLYLIHVEEALLILGTILIYVLFVSFHLRKKYILRAITVLGMAYVILILTSQFNIYVKHSVNMLERFLEEVYNNLFSPISHRIVFDINFKLNDLIHGHHFILLFLFIIATLLILIKGNARFLIVASIAWLLLAVYFLPFQWTYRIFKELNLFFSCVIVLPFSIILCSLKKIKVNIMILHKCISPPIVTLTFLLIFLCLTPILVIPIYQRFSFYSSEFFPSKDIQSPLTFEEWEAAIWMREHLPSDAILISDYFTMWVIGPLANKVLPIEKFMCAGGPGKNSSLYLQLLYVKQRVFLANDSKEAYIAIKEMQPIWVERDYLEYLTGKGNTDKYIILLSKRTSRWVRDYDFYGFAWKPDTFINQRLLELFADKSYFREVYRNEFLHVFVTN